MISGGLPATMTLPATTGELIDWGTRRLDSAGLAFGHGTDNARDEAAALVLFVLQPGSYPEVHEPGQAVPVELARRAIELIEERIRTRKPAAYLTREAWFAGLPFYVDERVLVPRSPLAELVENRFLPWVYPDRVSRILDLCSGSGCIACACAEAFPQAYIDAADVSADALAVAGMNIRRHGLGQRVTPVASDLFSGLAGRRYDIIVSNPPYVPRSELAGLPDEYRHEPALGLAAGDDGLDAALGILRNARPHLTGGGILVVEVGYSQPALEAVLPDIPFTWLEFEYGGEGVFLLERAQLDHCQSSIDRVMENRVPA